VTGSVRQARVALADALAGVDAFEEADGHLERALADPGPEPPDWVILERRAELASRRGDHPFHVAQLLAVCSAAPIAVAEAAARNLTHELDGADASICARAAPEQAVAALVERARAEESPDLAAAAVRLALLRGEPERAVEVAKDVGETLGVDDPSLQTTIALDEVYRLLAEGRPHDALDVLRRRELPRDPLVAAARAAVALGLADPIDALDRLKDTPRTLHGAIVRCITHLGLAGRDDSDRPHHYDMAEEAAANGGRLDQSGDESLLLRAQVALERGIDLPEARHLLDSAVRRRPLLRDLWWWRLQGHTRSDPRWSAVQIEVAAVIGDDAAVIEEYEALESWPPTETTHGQDAGMAWAAAGAFERCGRLVDAAESYRRAAKSLGVVGGVEIPDDDRQLQALEAAAKLDPSPTSYLDLAERYLRQALNEEGDASRVATEQGLSLLGAAEGMEDVDADRAGYLHGLLLSRRAAGADASVAERWAPLPHLLVAALSDPGEPYRSANAALALDQVGLSYQAMHFAERALETSRTETDLWLDEVAVVTRFNYSGRISEDTDRRLDGLDEQWAGTVRGYAALLNDDLDRLRALLPDMVIDAPWADLARACATARCEGLEASRALFAAMLDSNAGPQHKGQAELYLGEAEKARARFVQGRADELMDAEGASFHIAWCDVVIGDPDAPELLRRRFSDYTKPFELREVLAMLLPVLGAAYRDRPGVTATLDDLRSVATRDLDALESMFHPLSEHGMEPGDEVDRQLLADVACLLEATDILQRDRDGDVVETITPAVEANRGTALGAAAEELAERLRARTIR
jgi:tetratricopeptide (TPR) repeat protein